jgi:hypothetical protein
MVALLFLRVQTLAQSAQDQLVGTWMLVSVYIEGPDGTRFDSFGPDPTGIPIMDGNGHISVQFISSGLPKFASNDRRTALRRRTKLLCRESSTTLASTRSVMRIVRSTFTLGTVSFPNWKGADQKRFLALTEDEMKWINPTASSGPGFTGHTVWKRAT